MSHLSDVSVRVMRDEELADVRAVSVEAFGGDETIGVLIAALNASRGWIDDLSFVAELGGEIVGQVLFTRATLDVAERLVDVLVLSPVGIRTELQGRGIGSHLISESLKTVELREEPVVFLEGNPSYYPRFGFEPGNEHGFRKPSLRIPDLAFMARRSPSWKPWMTGTLVYPDPWWDTDSVGLR